MGEILTNFGDDVYISLASMDEESLLDALLGSFDTVRGSFFMFVESGCISTNIEFTVP